MTQPKLVGFSANRPRQSKTRTWVGAVGETAPAQVSTPVYGLDPDFIDGLPTDPGIRQQIARASAQFAALARAGVAAAPGWPVAFAASR